MNRKHIIRNLRQKGIAFDNNASTPDLQAFLNAAPAEVQNKICKTFNFAKGFGEKVQVSFNAANPAEPARIFIEDIGKDPWTGEGMSDADMQKVLNEITPKTRTLDFFTSSCGGSVKAAKGIRALLQMWEGRITNTISFAASSGTWCIPADETRAFKNSDFYVHCAFANVTGNKTDLADAIDFLAKTDNDIAEILSEQCDCEPQEMLAYMDNGNKGTMFDGRQCLALGLVDTLIDGDAQNRITPEMLNVMRQKLAALNSIRSATGTDADAGRAKPNQNPQPENTMKEKIALLNKRGITPPADADEAKLDSLIAASNLARNLNIDILNAWKVKFNLAATDDEIKNLVLNGKPAVAAAGGASGPTMEDLQNQINGLTEANNASKNLRITNRIEQAIKDDKLPTNMKDKAIARAKNDETYLDEVEAMPSKPPGAEPIGGLPFNSMDVIGESFTDLQNAILNNGPRFRAQFFGPANAAKLSSYDDVEKKRVLTEMGNRAKLVAKLIADPKNKAKIVQAWNANTIDSGLQRQVILQEYVEEYEIPLLPLKAFCTLFSDVVLEGTDEVDVAFYNLDTNASTSWNPATGYAAAGATQVDTRKVFIGGSGLTSGNSATTGYCKDRLFQQLAFSSYEQTRQPYVNWQKLITQKANKLGVDVFTQFVSRVLTRANFGAPSKIVAAALFTADDIADLAEIATGLNWPVAMRQLVLNHTYRTPLLKDPTFKYALNYGNSDPIRKGIVADAYGFAEIPIVPNLTNYSPAGENLVGWINHISAALFATAPIMPTEEVRALMTRFDIAISPQLGANICYRRFGNVTLDQTNEIAECSFGGGKGVASALKLFASQ